MTSVMIHDVKDIAVSKIDRLTSGDFTLDIFITQKNEKFQITLFSDSKDKLRITKVKE